MAAVVLLLDTWWNCNGIVLASPPLIAFVSEKTKLFVELFIIVGWLFVCWLVGRPLYEPRKTSRTTEFHITEMKSKNLLDKDHDRHPHNHTTIMQMNVSTFRRPRGALVVSSHFESVVTNVLKTHVLSPQDR